MKLNKISNIIFIRLIFMVTLLIWLTQGSGFELLYGRCLAPAWLNWQIQIVYFLITLFTLLAVFIFRKHRIAF